MGFSGAFLGTLESFEFLQKSVMVAAGIVIILMGLALAGWLPFFRLVLPENGGRFTLLFSRWVRKIFSGKLATGAFYPMGIVLGFIPCGLVYTALIAAARAGMDAESKVVGLIKGLLLMLLFGLGTLPSLLLFGRLVNVISLKIRAKIYKFSALFMITMGIIFLVRAL